MSAMLSGWQTKQSLHSQLTPRCRLLGPKIPDIVVRAGICAQEAGDNKRQQVRERGISNSLRQYDTCAADSTCGCQRPCQALRLSGPGNRGMASAHCGEGSVRVGRVFRLLRNLLLLSFGIAIGLLGLRVWQTQRGPALHVWHTFIPAELHAADIDRIDWDGYIKAENALFDSVRANVTDNLRPDERTPLNRYYSGSPIYPGHFKPDWNRSYIMRPDGKPRGAVVLLHGLTDSPYSLRHVAEFYRAHGFVAIGIRLPGHGTVPSGLMDASWPDWMAATRLAVREAKQLVPEGKLHIVGFSNGGALAMKYAMDALDDPKLARPDQLVLISPMIGITEFARFAGLAGLPAMLPRFAKAAWLGIVAEFNPFKYNSFPVEGARQSWALTQALQSQIDRRASNGRLEGLPPILTFQSVLDSTVSTPAVINALYARLPANGSELDLFDINHNGKVGILFTTAAATALQRVLPPAKRLYRTVVVTNARAGSDAMVARITEVGSTESHDVPLSDTYPDSVYSLSHVALPFPPGDSLYGMKPDPND
jgi:alpha-beta hydrolase superfamily lysophospholipase